ncbi:hypothetical protein GCM10019017_11470 [Streptomyces showdoensis]
MIPATWMFHGWLAVGTAASRPRRSRASSIVRCGVPAPKRVADAVSTAAATSRGPRAATREAAATRRLRSRASALRWSDIMPQSRPRTSRNMIAEKIAMTPTSRSGSRRSDWKSSRTGAMREAAASRSRRRSAIPGAGAGAGSVRPVMEGCRAARPQAVKKTTQPMSQGVPTCQVPSICCIP